MMPGVMRLMIGLALASSAITSASAAEVPACPTFRWVTLGTAGGPVPTPDRSEPANLLLAGDRAVLVDAGDGAVGQLARIGVGLGQIDAVVISHNHLDHTGGLAAVIGLRWMNQFPGVLTIYGPQGTKAVVDGIVASMAAPAAIGFGLGALPPQPADKVKVVELTDGAEQSIGPFVMKVAANSHFDHAGPHTANAPQSFSIRFAMDTRVIVYTGDTGPSAMLASFAKGATLLVSEVIDLDRIVGAIRQSRKDASPEMLADMERHLATHHLRPEEVGKIAGEAGVSRVVLTHFAIPPGPLAQSEPALRQGIATRFAGTVDLARDLSSFDLGCVR